MSLSKNVVSFPSCLLFLSFPLDFHRILGFFSSKHTVAGELLIEFLSVETEVLVVLSCFVLVLFFLQVKWHHLKAMPPVNRKMMPLQE